MKTVEVLKKARALVTKEWCQDSFGQNQWGEMLEDNDLGQAVAFCVRGACMYVGTTAEARRASQELAKTLGLKTSPAGLNELADWNDAPKRTQRQVVNLFTRTIKRIEAEP